jgi:hypothetical protein
MAIPAGDSHQVASGGVIAAGRHYIVGNQRIAIWGQSNAVGRADRADIAAAPLSADAGLATFDAGTFSRVYIWDGSNYAQLSAANNGASAGQFGPEFGIAVRWMRETTTGNLYIDKEALGSTSIDYWAPGGTAYIAAQTNRTNANAWLSAHSITLANPETGWLWVQGEYDSAQIQSWYETRISALIDGRVADGLMTTNAKRMLAQMVVGSAQYGAGVAAAKASYAAANSTNTIAPDMVPTFAGYMRTDDQVHANGRGQVHLGYRAFEYFFSASHISV